MNFKICKMNFTGAVHFGEGGLTTSSDTLMADTVFAAMCQEAVSLGNGMLEKLIESVSSGKLLISDALPYIGNTIYVPKPILEIKGREEGDSKIKKALKKLRYIPADKIDIYLKGEMDIESEARLFHDGFSIADMIEKVTVPEEEITRPYAVAVRRYRKGSGLYLCIGYESENICESVFELLNSLSFSGLGGERSSGYGRFTAETFESDELTRRLSSASAEKYMSLSVCLPSEEEMDKVIDGADFLTVKRSGWVSSVTYADSMRKKRDIYMLAAGSVFCRKFAGDIYDVGDGGSHPVYRYGKPMLMGII